MRLAGHRQHDVKGPDRNAYWAYDASLMMRIAQVLDRPQDGRVSGSVRESPESIQPGVRKARWHRRHRQPNQLRVGLHMNLLSPKDRAIVSGSNWLRTIKAHDCTCTGFWARLT